MLGREQNSTERKRVAAIAQPSSRAVIPGEAWGKGVNTGRGDPSGCPHPVQAPAAPALSLDS